MNDKEIIKQAIKYIKDRQIQYEIVGEELLEILTRAEKVRDLLDNIKNGNEIDFNIMVEIQSWEQYVRLGKTKKERLQILIMCYVVNPTLEILNNWTLENLLDYIEETDDKEFYEKDMKEINKCVDLINELGE